MELDSVSATLFKDRKSKFYAHLYRVENPEQAEKLVKLQKRRYRKARHHCWAYRIEIGGNVLEKAHDDGEVGAPGKALLELMRGNDMLNHMLVVSRIFGGVKLGIGGVRRAFMEAGRGALQSYKEKYSEKDEK